MAAFYMLKHINISLGRKYPGNRHSPRPENTPQPTSHLNNSSSSTSTSTTIHKVFMIIFFVLIMTSAGVMRVDLCDDPNSGCQLTFQGSDAARSARSGRRRQPFVIR